MLNIAVLYAGYAIGGFDVIVAFFILSALWAAFKKRPYLAVILLSLGGGVKLLPYVLILPTALLLGRNWRERTSLLLTAATATILVYLPFCLFSMDSITGFFVLPKVVAYSGIAGLILPGIFAVLYLIISLNAIKDSGEKSEEKLLYYMTTIMFLTFTVMPTRIRYFVSITPLLALIIPKHKKFGWWVLSILFVMFFLYAHTRDAQLGLLVPLGENFLNIPSFQETLSRFIDIDIAYRILARVLPLMFFTSAWWIWRLKPRILAKKEV